MDSGRCLNDVEIMMGCCKVCLENFPRLLRDGATTPVATGVVVKTSLEHKQVSA